MKRTWSGLSLYAWTKSIFLPLVPLRKQGVMCALLLTEMFVFVGMVVQILLFNLSRR